MSIDEQARRELHDRLDEALGPAAAGTLMASLAPRGWDDVATKDDLARVEERFTARFDASEERFTARFDASEERSTARFERIEERFDGLTERFDLKLGSATNELRADFAVEMTAQTRAVILALLGTFFSSGGLVLAAARLG